MKDKIQLRNEGIYSIFTRNYSSEGTFSRVKDDLDRIKSLGFNIIWLLPIHPQGLVGRKGSIGSPYAIKDYRDTDKSQGTIEEFKELVEEVHKKDMKILIDVVFHHTSRDSKLLLLHEEWFFKNKEGKLGNKVGDWSDVYDLDFTKKDLWDYLYESLKIWAEIGVDGFRCDVAPMIPMEFWEYVKNKLENDGFSIIWLSESIEPSFIKYLRDKGHIAHSDGEVYRVFDILYDYDVKGKMMDYLAGKISLKDYLSKYMEQEYIYPVDYVKLRFLENHDNPRAKEIIKDRRRLIHFTAFMALLKGAFLFYNGQETMSDKYVDLFDKATIEWNFDEEMVSITKRLMEIKKEGILRDGILNIEALSEESCKVEYKKDGEELVGIFNLGEKEESEFLKDKNAPSHINLLAGKSKEGFNYPYIYKKKEK